VALEEWQDRRELLVKQLRAKVFSNYPSEPGPLELLIDPKVEGAYFREVSFVSEPGVRVRALLNRPDSSEKKLPALLYVASTGEDKRAIELKLRHARGEKTVRFVVFPRGTGFPGWEESYSKDVLRNSMHVGHTVDTLRLWDILRSIEVLQAEEAVDRKQITIAGSGVEGVLGLYAAILKPEIYQVLLIRPPSSHVEGPIFLNILRYTDIPEAAALLAPRRLNFYSRIPKPFEVLRQVYGLYGCPEHLFLTMDLYSVLYGRYDHSFSSGL
jgi:hypothetical protein